MRSKNHIITSLYRYIVEQINNNSNLVDDYVFDSTRLNTLITNARKWKETDFIEEYVYLNDISVYYNDNFKIDSPINKGDSVLLVRPVRDSKGNRVYDKYSPYDTVIAEKDYGKNIWDFIMDNTKDLQDEARVLYNKNKKGQKPKFKKSDKTIVGYHASSKKFDTFMYDMHKQSGQLGANYGFFFFKDKKYADNYASIIKENAGVAYVYECTIKANRIMIEQGVNIGTNWNRIEFLQNAEGEGYDAVIIEMADTGYGITDEIVVFDDDNIQINNVLEV